MLERVPSEYRTPAVARALTSPAAVLLGGIGMSAAILAGVPVLGAAVVGVACWAGRVALGIPRRPKAERIEPQSLPEPWRGFVRKALAARNRFDKAVDTTEPGPLRDRLAEMADRVSVGATECWKIARRAAALDAAVAELDARGIRAQLDQCESELRRDPDRSQLAATAEALRRQLASATRLADVVDDARDRLRRLDAELDEAVARALELSLGSGDAGALAPVGSTVDGVVGELESLRQALEESRV